MLYCYSLFNKVLSFDTVVICHYICDLISWAQIKLILSFVFKTRSDRYRTTGLSGFAECQGHSAKPNLHSAKALPSAGPSAALGKKWVGKGVFAECFLSGTRQSLCRVPDTRQSWNRKKTEKMGKMQKNGNFFYQ